MRYDEEPFRYRKGSLYILDNIIAPSGTRKDITENTTDFEDPDVFKYCLHGVDFRTNSKRLPMMLAGVGSSHSSRTCTTHF